MNTWDMKQTKSCNGCIYHDDFTAVCVNADSPHVADFWDGGCVFKEVKEKDEEIGQPDE